MILSAILSKLAPYIIGLLALIGGALGLYAKGRGDAKAKARAQNDRDNRETQERIDNAPLASDAADALQRLRERKPTGPVQRNRK